MTPNPSSPRPNPSSLRRAPHGRGSGPVDPQSLDARPLRRHGTYRGHRVGRGAPPGGASPDTGAPAPPLDARPLPRHRKYCDHRVGRGAPPGVASPDTGAPAPPLDAPT